MRPSWGSQVFRAEGSSTAQGILRQLGRPDLDECEVLIREAAQNSWDARSGESDVSFQVDVSQLGVRSSAWAETLLPGPAHASVPGFSSALSPQAWVLRVGDRGTLGLGGPTSAAQRPAAGERSDFVQFLRNVGEPRDSSLGGGTYGFGKSVFYRASRAGTILVDTQTRTVGGLERRLLGAALGQDFWADSTRFTGRHWWGLERGGVVEPLVGAEAESVGELLGLVGFPEGATGTDIYIVDPKFLSVADGPEDRPAHEFANRAASAMLWHLWPKFRSISRESVAMEFSLSVDRTPLHIPRPDSIADLRPFVASLSDIADGAGRTYRRAAQPKIEVGEFAATLDFIVPSEDPIVLAAKPFDGRPMHVARMRQARLVVDYLEGPEPSDPQSSYGGVFVASAAADEHFATSEPPTHDAWNAGTLSEPSRSIVLGARRWVRQALSQQFPGGGDASRGSIATLGGGARRLAGLLATPSGGLPSTNGPSRSRLRGAGRPTELAEIVSEPTVNHEGDVSTVSVDVRVPIAGAPFRLRGHLDVLVDGGARETSVPPGIRSPRVLGWMEAERPSSWIEGPDLDCPRPGSRWTLVGSFDADIMIRFRLEVITDGS